MIYCSSGFNRIVIRPNGEIYTCYSLNKCIGNISTFKENNLHVTQCDQKNCIVCDQNFITTNQNKSRIQKRKLDIHITVTERCFHFCPYCTHSDYSQKVNSPIYPLPIQDYVNFLLNIKRKSTVIIMGGEPTIRKDLYQLFVPTRHTLMLFSSALYFENSIKIFKEVQKNNVKLIYIPALHHTSKDFDWNIFWDTVKEAQKIPTIQIPRVKVVNYKLNNILNDIRKQCQNLKLKIEIASLDSSVVSDRIKQNKINMPHFEKL